jgi:hypothetical protein
MALPPKRSVRLRARPSLGTLAEACAPVRSLEMETVIWWMGEAVVRTARRRVVVARVSYILVVGWKGRW